LATAFSSRHTISTDVVIRANERYDTIDLVRGWALLGVALVNVHAIARGWMSHYALDRAAHAGDVIAEYIVGLVFAHRAFPSLAFLFGLGIAMQWRRLTRDADTDRMAALNALRSRYVALFILGFTHAMLLWPGDIVSTYALIALAILWAWPKQDARLRFWATVTSLLALAFYVSIASTYFGELGPSEPIEAIASSFAQSTLFGALAMHPGEYLRSGIVQIMLPEVWAAILIGAWLGQSGKFEQWLRGEIDARGWFVFGFAILAMGSALEATASRMNAWSYMPTFGRGDGLLIAGIPFVLVGSVFALFFIARAWPAHRFSLARSLLIAAGRTPLTQFFGQSVVFFVVFSDSLIGAHGELGRAAYSLVALATFMSIALFSRAWLAFGGARGPAEMLWMALAKRFE
jgi:uncharacterized protein